MLELDSVYIAQLPFPVKDIVLVWDSRPIPKGGSV